MSNPYDDSLEEAKPYFLPPFSVLPAGTSPTRGVIYFSQGVRWSLIVAVAAFFFFSLVVWGGGVVLDHSTMWDRTMFRYTMGLYFDWCLHAIPATINLAARHPVPLWFDAQADEFTGLFQTYPFAMGVRFVLPIVGSIAALCFTLKHMLVPQYKSQYDSGPRLFKGRLAMRALAARLLEPTGHATAWAAARQHVLAGRWPTAWRTYWKIRKTPPFMAIHPDLPMAAKDWFAAGVLLSGAPGSGKTQVGNTFISQIIGEGPYAHLAPEGGHKALIYDIKKEFTRLYGRPAILNPEDARSMVWDIAADMADPVAVAAMAAALIKENEKQPFFDRAAKQIFIGGVRSLYADHGHDWGFYEMANVLSLPIDEMVALMTKHDPEARKAYDMAYTMAKKNLEGGDDNTTVNNIIASLNVAAMVIFKLSQAWGRPSRKAVRFSVKKWVQDDYTGTRQVFIHGTKDKDLRAWITMLFDTAIRSIVHDLDGNEHGRHIFVVVDEFPTLPAADFGELMAVARDRGCVPILMFQDENQLEQTYGPHGAKILLTMPSIRIYAKMRAGTDGPSKAAEGLGKYRIASITTTQSGQVGGGQPTFSIGSHTESRAVVTPIQLTADTLIGKQGPAARESWQNWPTGFAIRALLAGIGPHIYRLDWPVINTGAMKKAANREGFVQAAWTAEFAAQPTASQAPAAGGPEGDGPQPPAIGPDAPVVTVGPDAIVETAETLDTTTAPAEPDAADGPESTIDGDGWLEEDPNAEPDGEEPDQPPPPLTVVVIDEPLTHAEQVQARHAKGTPASKESGHEDDDDPVDSVLEDIGTELALHAAGLGAIAPAVEIGKAVLEVLGGPKAAKPTVSLDKHGKPVKKQVIYY